VAVNLTGCRILLNQRVGRLEPILINAEYVRLFFETIIAKNLNKAFGSAIPNLSAEQINATIVPLPPLAEQHRIVAKVNDLTSLANRLEAKAADARSIAERLMVAVAAEVSPQLDITSI
jgi:type I restriction enzyme, S subunit